MSCSRTVIVAAALVSMLGANSSQSLAGSAGHQAQPVPAVKPGTNAVKPGTNEDAQTLADFKTRVDTYASLHRKLDGSLPKLSKEATPEAIDRHQRDLGALIASARADAAQGDIFTPQIQALVKTLIARLFAHSDRRKLRASIMDENPGKIRLTVNGRYPDAVPLSTMPAEVLQNLPPLPEEVEYRFVGDTLILLDSAAHIVPDFIAGALPR